MQFFSLVLTAGALTITTVDALALPRVVCQQNADGSWNYPSCAGRASSKVRRFERAVYDPNICLQLPTGKWNHSACDSSWDKVRRFRCIQKDDGSWNYPQCTTAVTDFEPVYQPDLAPLSNSAGPISPGEKRSVEEEDRMGLTVAEHSAPEARSTQEGGRVLFKVSDTSSTENAAIMSDVPEAHSTHKGGRILYKVPDISPTESAAVLSDAPEDLSAHQGGKVFYKVPDVSPIESAAAVSDVPVDHRAHQVGKVFSNVPDVDSVVSAAAVLDVPEVNANKIATLPSDFTEADINELQALKSDYMETHASGKAAPASHVAGASAKDNAASPVDAQDTETMVFDIHSHKLMDEIIPNFLAKLGGTALKERDEVPQGPTEIVHVVVYPEGVNPGAAPYISEPRNNWWDVRVGSN